MASTSVVKRTRGPNKQPAWSRRPEDGMAVLRLALDVSDPLQRHRVEQMFSAAFSLRRALQGDARDRARAFKSAHHERERDPAAARDRLGLSRKALEYAGYAHLDAAPHLRRFATKALALHMADSVWTALERHLFRDTRSKTHGMPRVGGWYDFTRIPGRARSHQKPRKWETFRLHGSLDGHRAAYADHAGGQLQPRRMRPIIEPRSWWTYDGPMAMVFSGLDDGTLVVPVRLPASPANQPILDHYLRDSSRWHKIDLVRRRDPNTPGGWRYEAHLAVLTPPYASLATHARRDAARANATRSAGIDVNVSNVTVASHARGTDLHLTRIVRDEVARERGRRETKRDRRRKRALDRSRRAANRAQYQLSRRQVKRARRRAAAGLRPVLVIPAGPRLARADGRPLQAFRKDSLSVSYRRGRAAQAADAASKTQARRDRAREIAATVVAEHGCRFVVEDVTITPWARSWGRSLAALSPGTILAAIDREAEAVATRHAIADGGVARASTASTTLSQRCLCGMRVRKSLADRVHACDACGLVGDRDAVSATLAACVRFAERGTPASAYVDAELTCALRYEVRTRSVLAETRMFSVKGRQDVPSESTVLSARDGSFVATTGPTPDWFVVARRNVGTAPRPIPNETSFRWTTSERPWMRTNLPGDGGIAPLRDSS